MYFVYLDSQLFKETTIFCFCWDLDFLLLLLEVYALMEDHTFVGFSTVTASQNIDYILDHPTE